MPSAVSLSAISRAVPTLIQALHDPDPIVRRHAAWAVLGARRPLRACKPGPLWNSIPTCTWNSPLASQPPAPSLGISC